MTLNWAERLLVDNPVRALVQRHFEASILLDLGAAVKGGRVLEIGCGRGAGVGILIERFRAGHVCAIDIDLRRLPRGRRPGASFIAGAAEHLPFPNRSFDAVFDFGVLHHVPEWQTAVAEVARVLKPSGRFYFEEVTAAALDRWIYRALLKHPTENRFDEARFLAELSACGLQCVADPRHLVGWRHLRRGVQCGSQADHLNTRAVISKSPNRSDAIVSAVTRLMFRLQLLNRLSRLRGIQTIS